MSFIRKSLLVTGALGSGIPVAVAQSLPQSVIQCASVDNDSARLECFDKEVARLTQRNAAVAPTQSPPVQVGPPASPVASTQPKNASAIDDDFGVSGELARRRAAEEKRNETTPRELRAAVTKVRTKAYGEVVLELDNGQIWEQPERKSGFSIKEGENIRITQGAMGSYFLQADSGATSRIRRVR
jgi:hypothetical protein